MGYRSDDVRRLVDRLGTLGTMVLAACHRGRVAVVDSECEHPFAEIEARRRGYEVRYFGDAEAALAWLRAPAN